MENLWAETLLLVVGEVAEDVVGGALVVGGLFDDDGVLLHFSEEGVHSFVITIK